MSFANPSSPAKWFLYTGIFFRWLCVYLVFANVLDEIEFFAPFIPDGYADFTWGAMIGVWFALVLTFIEIIWIHFLRKRSYPIYNKKIFSLIPVFSSVQ